jgi:hypothetical protein
MLFGFVLHGLFVYGEFVAFVEGGSNWILSVFRTEGRDYEVTIEVDGLTCCGILVFTVFCAGDSILLAFDAGGFAVFAIHLGWNKVADEINVFVEGWVEKFVICP